MEDVAAELDTRLAAASVPGSSNTITASDLRGWAVGFLREYDEELARFPQLTGKPHWNLLMKDAELKDALFAILVFWSDGLEFHCGTGNSYDVQSWSGEYPSDPTGLMDDMSREFRVAGGSLRFHRAVAEAWLGRSW